MPSFPGSVKSFTTKNSGDVIQAAHVNDIQDEVNAIEAGYINGTAPLNSSKSTVATLSVTGGSTMNTLTVDGGSTFGSVGVTIIGPLTVSGGSTFASRPVMPPPDAVKVTLGSTVAASSNTSTLSWISQEYITNSSMHSTGTNPSRLTPQSTGLYMMHAGVVSSSNSTGYRQIFLRDSSGTDIARTVEYANGTSTDVGALFQVSGFKRFDVLGSYMTVVYQNVGASTLSLIAESWFAMHKL